MGWLKNIFKMEVTKVTYVVRCENIVKKPRKDEILLIKFPNNIPTDCIKKFKDILRTELKKKESIMLFDTAEISCGKVKIKEGKKCKRTK